MDDAYDSKVQLPGTARRTGPQELGQLASVLEVVARLDPGELKKLTREVVQERKEMEKQLSRRRDLEQQLREARGRLDEVRERRRKLDAESAATKRKVAHLQDELVFVGREVKGVDEDLDHLRKVSGLGAGQDGRRGPAPYSNSDEAKRDVLSKVRAERELVVKDQRAIEDLRHRLDQIFQQKLEAQAEHQALLEKHRQSEQDRGLMLTAIEADRGKLGAMRAERLKLAEERSALERDLQDVTQEQLLVQNTAQATTSARISSAASGRPDQQRQTPSRTKGVPQQEMPQVVYGTAPHSAPLPGQPHLQPGSGQMFGPRRDEPPPRSLGSACGGGYPLPSSQRPGYVPPSPQRHDGRGIREGT